MPKRKKRTQTTTLSSIIVAVLLVIGGIYTNSQNDNGSSKHNNDLLSTAIKTVTGGSQSPSNNAAPAQNVASQSKLAELNFQSGDDPVVAVNHNKATLKAADWKSNHVDYQNLDNLNRTSSPNTGYLEKRNLASGSLRVRQYVEPTGWHQKFVDKDPIVNRGHLMAYSISKGISTSGQYDPNDQSGDQNNPKNLFTQSAYSNQQLQTKYEEMIRDALKQNQKVIYQAQPIFRSNELMARGVHLQAVSTDGQLNFNVYIFNVQPQVKFDYATGRSTIDRSMKVDE